MLGVVWLHELRRKAVAPETYICVVATAYYAIVYEVNVTLTNRDNHQHKIVAELVAVRPGSLVPSEPLGDSASAPATLNAGDSRLLTMSLDTSNLQPGQRYKVGILIYANGNSTASPLKRSLLAISYVSTIAICDPLEIVNANLSLCNEIGILGVSSDVTTP